LPALYEHSLGSTVEEVAVNVHFLVGYTDQGNRYVVIDQVQSVKKRIEKFPVSAQGTIEGPKGGETGRSSSAG
jgi:hypothetical protein